jgi:hypothetical protein
MKTIVVFHVEPLWKGFHVEAPSVERVVYGIHKGSTWKFKRFFKGLSYGDSQKLLGVLDSTFLSKNIGYKYYISLSL